MKSEPRLPGLGWRLGLSLIFIVVIVGVYYWAHKPVDPRQPTDLLFALQVGGVLLDLLTVAVLVVIAGGLGRAIPLHRSGLIRAERLALDGLLGLGIISLVALLLGLVGLFRGIVFWPLLAVVALLIRHSLAATLRDWRVLFGSIILTGGWVRFLALVSFALLGLALVRALAPPFAWDALTYHLVGPQRYLAAGRILPAPENHFLGFPQLVEVLYGVTLSLFGRDTTAAPLHFAFGLLGLLAIAGLVRRHAGAVAAWTAIALALSAGSINLLFGWPYVDLAAFAYSAAAFVVITRWRDTTGFSLLILAGVFAGLAMGVKYTAVALALSLAVYILLTARRALHPLVIFAASAFLAFFPWLIKGALLYGNPVYPFVFGGLSWDAQRAATFSTSGAGLLASPDLWQLPLLPFSATVFGIEKGAGYAFTAGPWLLIAWTLLLPIWPLLDARARALARDALILAAPILLVWAVLAATSAIGMQTRLVMVGLPMSIAAGALTLDGFARWPEKPLHLGFIVRVVFALTLVLALLDSLRLTIADQPMRYLVGEISRDTYLEQVERGNLQAHVNAMRALATLPPGSQVRFLWEPRSAFCPATITCWPDILFDAWAHPLQQGQSPDEILRGWQASGDDYVLFWHAGYDASLSDLRLGSDNLHFSDARDRWLEPLWTDGLRYTLYQWRTDPVSGE